MKKIKYIVVHSSDNEEHKIEIKDKFSRTANAIMNAPGYLEYIKSMVTILLTNLQIMQVRKWLIHLVVRILGLQNS